MHMRLFTVRFNPVTEHFDDSPVVSFLVGKEVLSIREHFFVKDDVPYLLMVVRYRAAVLPIPPAALKPEQPRDQSWRQILTEADWPLFNALRAWRTNAPSKKGFLPMSSAITVNWQKSSDHALRPWRHWGVSSTSERGVLPSVRKHLRHVFPLLLSQSAFNRRLRRLWGAYTMVQKSSIDSWGVLILPLGPLSFKTTLAYTSRVSRG